MYQYVLKRMLATIPTLLVVAIAVFALVRSIPGDPAVVIVGDLQDPQALARIRHDLGLDRPLPVQFFIWLREVASLDLGNSLITHEPVLSTMLERFVVTARVVIAAVLISLLIAVPAGMFAAWRQNRGADLAVVTLAIVCLSVPSFWVGLMLILLFGIELQVLPIVGYIPIEEDFSAGIAFLFLPVAALVLTEIGSITRMVRSSTIEVMRQEYVTHARAKGLSEPAVMWRHVFKNSFGPTLSLAGWILGTLLGGAAVIETVFTLPGLGRLLVDSVYMRDYPMVQGITLFVALIYIGVNLLVDLLYPLLDPRVRL